MHKRDGVVRSSSTYASCTSVFVCCGKVVWHCDQKDPKHKFSKGKENGINSRNTEHVVQINFIAAEDADK